MSSRHWVEPCREKRPQEAGPEAEQGGGATAHNPCCMSHAGKAEKQDEEEEEEVQKRSVNQYRPRPAPGGVLEDPTLSGPTPKGPTCSGPHRDRKQQLEDPRGPGSFYFFGGSNGAEIVTRYCEGRGWKRIHNKDREDFKLKWCETKSTGNYSHFRAGQQLMFQIPNNKVLTTKIGLLVSLREQERILSRVDQGPGPRRLKMKEFIPTTFRMDIREEREAFFTQHEGGNSPHTLMWICKPTGLNQGRGIFLLKNQADVSAFRLKLKDMEEKKNHRKLHCCRHYQPLIVQEYIRSPLLLNRRKFDVRSYLLIACTSPYMVFFRHGYVRLTCDPYDPTSNNLTAHLTNQYMQKKNPVYSQVKEDTVWSMETFNAYVNDSCPGSEVLPRDWVLGAFTKRMQQIMTQCFMAVKSKLDCRLGFFDLIGCDFMVDEDFTVWLLEMNCNPALHTNCMVLKEVIPSTVEEALDLTLEIFNKCRLKKRLLPLSSQRDFLLLYQGVYPPGNTTSTTPHYALGQTSSRRNPKLSSLRAKQVGPTSLDPPVDTLGRDRGKASPRPTTSTSPLNAHRNPRPRPRPLFNCRLRTKDDVQLPEAQQKECVISLSHQSTPQTEGPT